MLRSVAAAALALALIGCYHQSDYSPVDPGILTLTADANTIPADGVARAHLTATISSLASASHRVITFSTTAGTLVGAAAPGTTRDVAVDVTGAATVDLLGSTNDETAHVTASVKDVPAAVQHLDVRFARPGSVDVIRFVTAPFSAPADGSTLTLLTVSVTNAQGLPSASRSVAFTTTAGSFLPAGTPVALDAAGDASVQLQSASSITTAVVRAAINTFTAQSSIDFTRAFPDSIEVRPQKLAVQPALSDTVTINLQLRRNVGKPTAGCGLSLSAVDSSLGSIGVFVPQHAASDDNGQATILYSTGDTHYTGPVTLIVHADGSEVVGSGVVQVVAPIVTPTPTPTQPPTRPAGFVK